MRIKIITVYADSGHAWAKVSKKELIKLGIESEISGFSYQNNSHAFLEEDSDLSIYIEALKLKGIEYKFKENYSTKRSKIRSYFRYHLPEGTELVTIDYL